MRCRVRRRVRCFVARLACCSTNIQSRAGGREGSASGGAPSRQSRRRAGGDPSAAGGGRRGRPPARGAAGGAVCRQPARRGRAGRAAEAGHLGAAPAAPARPGQHPRPGAGAAGRCPRHPLPSMGGRDRIVQAGLCFPCVEIGDVFSSGCPSCLHLASASESCIPRSICRTARPDASSHCCCWDWRCGCPRSRLCGATSQGLWASTRHGREAKANRQLQVRTGEADGCVDFCAVRELVIRPQGTPAYCNGLQPLRIFNPMFRLQKIPVVSFAVTSPRLASHSSSPPRTLAVEGADAAAAPPVRRGLAQEAVTFIVGFLSSILPGTLRLDCPVCECPNVSKLRHIATC